MYYPDHYFVNPPEYYMVEPEEYPDDEYFGPYD